MKKIVKLILETTLQNLSKIRFIENFLVNIPPSSPNKMMFVRLFSKPTNYSNDDIRLIERDGLKYYAHLFNYNDYILFFKVDFLHSLIYQHIKNGMTVLDICSNQGEVLMNMAKINTDGHNYGFEPISATFNKAKRNIALNDFKNVTLLNNAVSDKVENIKIRSFPENHSGGVQLTKNQDFWLLLLLI